MSCPYVCVPRNSDCKPLEVGASEHMRAGRYIRIDGVGKDQWGSYVINLQEVVAYDSTGTIIKPVSAQMSSTYNTAVASLCIEVSSGGKDTAMCHSGADDKDPWLLIDFGKSVAIQRIVVTNRNDCCKDRIVGACAAASCPSKKVAVSVGVCLVLCTVSAAH